MADLKEIVSELTSAVSMLAKTQEDTVQIIKLMSEGIQDLKKELKHVTSMLAQEKIG